MAGRQIVVDLVSDSVDFERSMARSAAAVEATGAKMQGAASKAADLDGRFSRVGDTVDASESKFMGTADLLDGMAATMGLNVGASIEMARGFGDMAGGMTATVIPALKATGARMGALASTMARTPWGRVTLAIAALGTAAAYASKDTDQFGKSMAFVKRGLENAPGMLRGWFNELIPGGQALNDLNTTLEDTRFGVDDVTIAMDGMARQQQTLGQFTGNLQGIMDDLAYSVGDYATKLHSASVQLAELYKRQGIFLSEAAAMQQLGIAGPYSAGNKAREFAPMPELPDVEGPAKRTASKIHKASNDAAKKAEKEAERQAKKAADALKKRFDKIEDILENALTKWNEKLTAAKEMAKGFKTALGLDLNAAMDDPFGLVAGARGQVARIRKWVDAIKRLRKLGFSEALIRPLIDQGPSSLETMVELSHVSKRDMNNLVKDLNGIVDPFATGETMRRTGVNVKNPQPLKVTLDVKGSDKDLVNLIKKWVRTEGGGNVQVAFGKR